MFFRRTFSNNASRLLLNNPSPLRLHPSSQMFMFCASPSPGTLSDAELLNLHETDPSRAAQIYEHRIKSISQSHDTQTIPTLFHIYTHLRDCYWRLDNDEQISKCSQKLYELDPNHIYSNFVMAIETYDPQLQLEFLLNAEKLITTDTPSNMIADILYRISANYSRQSDIPNARKYITKLNDIKDESFRVREYVFLAYLDLHENEPDKALANFLKAIEVDTSDESELEAKKHALEKIGNHYVSNQDFDNALKYFLMLYNDYGHKLGEIYQAICVCYKNKGAKLYQSKDYQESIQTYQSLLDFIDEQEKENNSKEFKELGDKYKYIAMKHTAQCYNVQHDTQQTKIWMMKVLEIAPEDWLSNYFLGRYALYEKDLDKALEYLMTAEEKGSNMMEISSRTRANAQNLMAIIYSKKGLFQRANVCMEIAFNLCNDMAYLYTSHAMMKAKERNYYDTYSNLKIVHELKPWKKDNPKEIEAHLKGIESAINGFEFEYSDSNKIALKCLIMIEYLRESNVKCVQYAVQYRSIDSNDEDVNEIYTNLTNKL